MSHLARQSEPGKFFPPSFLFLLFWLLRKQSIGRVKLFSEVFWGKGIKCIIGLATDIQIPGGKIVQKARGRLIWGC